MKMEGIESKEFILIVFIFVFVIKCLRYTGCLDHGHRRS